MTLSAVLAIDQGTTGTRAILYSSSGRQLAAAYQEFRQYYPRPAWVEHDPSEIWKSTISVIRRALQSARLTGASIATIGITNQRETTVLWDRRTGRPIGRAIVWQDRRGVVVTDRLKKSGLEAVFRQKTGLVLDPYFSGPKIAWLLQHVSGLRRRAARGDIFFGTIDSWLLWKLTGGKVHATDVTNASRTLLYNIRRLCWDSELMKILRVPATILPEVYESGTQFGATVKQGPLISGIPITAIMGDQQAALYGQACYRRGETKNTYGTGCFVVQNIGKHIGRMPFGLLVTVACDEAGKPVYALEGSIFIAGAAVQWLRDGLGFFKHAGETSRLAKSVKDTGGVVMIPAFAGLGSPYWNPNVRGVISGLTRGTGRAHIVRAALESIAHQTADVLELMQAKSGYRIRKLHVDGGATANPYLMEFQAGVLGIPVLVSDIAESTAWGIAKLAAKKAGIWKNLASIDKKRKYQCYAPRIVSSARKVLRKTWKAEVSRLLS
ncbi:MAG: glycerol kinase GlpK [Candidatus Omnitrophota bacterium]|nr:glycerol kinase GlpK [Candidatus Omnitrophota bacterium]